MARKKCDECALDRIRAALGLGQNVDLAEILSEIKRREKKIHEHGTALGEWHAERRALIKRLKSAGLDP